MRRIQTDFTWKKVAGAIGILASAWYLSWWIDRPKVYTGDVQGNRARIEVYSDRTVAEVFTGSLGILGVDLGSDRIYEKLMIDQDGQRTDLRTRLIQKYKDDRTAVNNAVATAAGLLNCARDEIAGGK